MIASKSIRRIWILGCKIVVCIFFGAIASNAIAAQTTLAWDPNTESDLAGYRIHYRTASGSYTVHTDVHNITSYTVTGLTAGQTYYFAATAYDASGNESGYSNPVSYAVPAANGAASAWSDYEDFVANKTNADLNANGIPDAQEFASTVDLDRDGVKDNLQKTIKSVKMVGKSVQTGVSIKRSPTALAIESVESEDPGQTGSSGSSNSKTMPFGLINSKIAVAKTGDQASVRLYLSKAAHRGSLWYRYDTVSLKWYDFSGYAKFAADFRSVELPLTDGGPGDADGVANGIIVTAGGIYVP